MSRIIRDRIKRQLDEAEGYLMLNLPQSALAILERRADWATMQFEASYLMGEALRSLSRYREALKPLEIAAALRPAEPGGSNDVHPGHGVAFKGGRAAGRRPRIAR